uniref:P n=1 Tax=Allium chinense virus 1 TaxID=2793720 RepID=A0A8D9UJ39_9RHAB|nr:TPA_asm: P [Allium chinense virus 1]
MDNHDYDDVSNPILDLPMSGIAGNDDEGDFFGDEDVYQNLQDTQGDPPLVNKNLTKEQESDEDVDDHDYNDADIDFVLEELREICSEQGIPCTGPMEQMVRIKHKKETIFYSSLTWFVRGITLANQTQIIPTVMNAMNDMKVETKLLQQASSKMNKEVEKASRLTGDIVEELNTITGKMQDSFRDSIQKFLEVHAKVNTSPHAPKGITIGDSMAMKDQTNSGVKVGGSAPTQTKPVEVEKETATPKAKQVIDGKKQILLRAGFKPNWIKDVGDDIIDMVYDDDMHASVSSVTLTPKIKKFIVDTIKERLTEFLQDD